MILNAYFVTKQSDPSGTAGYADFTSAGTVPAEASDRLSVRKGIQM